MRIIDYDIVLQRMRERGFVSLYHNSGAFGFESNDNVKTIGWIGPDDPTIRDAARGLARQVQPPYETSLANLLQKACVELNSTMWLLPKSHWHYELHFGNRELLEALLKETGIDPQLLRDRNDGSAIEFATSEIELLGETAKRLLNGLVGSDFSLVFPDAATLCTIHHHKQLWWQTSDSQTAEFLRQLVV